MEGTLAGKSAVITGSGRGIGKGIAVGLASEGASVVINDPGGALDGQGTDQAVADVTVAEIIKQGGKAVANYDSVADFDGAENLINTCVKNFGKIDILVNVAGIIRDRMIFNMTYEEWDAVLKVHLYGTFNCSRHACTIMRQQRSGRIINTTSEAWVQTVGHVNYGASKAGIANLSKSIAREMGRYGVTCNAIAPGAATRMSMSEETKAGIKKRYEAGLMTKARYEDAIDMPGPEFVAPLVAYLATDGAKDINGCVFYTSGTRIGLYSEPEIFRNLFKPREEGPWKVAELEKLMSATLMMGIVNPSPVEEKK